MAKKLFLKDLSEREGIEPNQLLYSFIGENLINVTVKNVTISLTSSDSLPDHLNNSSLLSMFETDKTLSVLVGGNYAFLKVLLMDEYLEEIVGNKVWSGEILYYVQKSDDLSVSNVLGQIYPVKSKTISISFDDLYIDLDEISEGKIAKIIETRKLTAKINHEDSLHPRAEKTYLNIIGALLEIIIGDSPGIEKHPSFKNEAELIRHFNSYRISGLSTSTLEQKFPKAKRAFQTSCEQ